MFRLQRISINVANSVTVAKRFMSSAHVKPLVDVTVDNEGIATVKLQRAPVNSINLDIVQAIHESIDVVEKNKCKGLVLTSAFPTVFSAGMDLMEFHKADLKRTETLKSSYFDVVTKLFGMDIITTAALNGYTGAGACIFALTCEYRVMTTGKAVIGLNDTAVGIPPASWVTGLMNRTMGVRNAEYALTTSFMFPAERALQVGLIDEVAADKEDAIQKCRNFIKLFDHIPPAVRAHAKRSLRQEYLTEIKNNREKIITNFVNLVTSPAIQDGIDQYVKILKQKSNGNK